MDNKDDFAFEAICDILRIVLRNSSDREFLRRALSFLRSIDSWSAGRLFFDVIVNVNKSPHHDVRGAVDKQFEYGRFVDLTEGNLSIEEFFNIPIKLRDLNVSGRVGVVLTGHWVMQTLALTTVVAMLNKAWGIAWIRELDIYAVERVVKNEPDRDVELISNEYGVLAIGFVDSVVKRKLEGIFGEVKIIDEAIYSTEDWRRLIKKALAYSLGMKKIRIYLEGPNGIPSILVAKLLESYMKSVTIIFRNFERSSIDSLELSHLNFREFNFPKPVPVATV